MTAAREGLDPGLPAREGRSTLLRRDPLNTWPLFGSHLRMNPGTRTLSASSVALTFTFLLCAGPTGCGADDDGGATSLTAGDSGGGDGDGDGDGDGGGDGDGDGGGDGDGDGDTLPCADVEPVSGMACIRGGAFTDVLDGPNVEHQLTTFLLDIDEVSVTAYQACVTASGCSQPSTTNLCNYSAAGKQAHGVNCVTWAQANTYCEWAGKRLPTEWEWEWAARGRGEDRLYPWGELVDTVHACWDKLDGSCALGSFSPEGDSRDGLRDMSGNLSEWTDSFFGEGTASRVTRGGSWISSDFGTISTRVRVDEWPTDQKSTLGFRCALTP